MRLIAQRIPVIACILLGSASLLAEPPSTPREPVADEISRHGSLPQRFRAVSIGNVVAASPDGRSVALSRWDGLWVWRLTGRQPDVVCKISPGSGGFGAASFSPDGRRLAVGPGGGIDWPLWQSDLPGDGVVIRLPESDEAAGPGGPGRTRDSVRLRTLSTDSIGWLDGDRVMGVGVPGVSIWDARTGETVTHFAEGGRPSATYGGDFSPGLGGVLLQGGRTVRRPLLRLATPNVATPDLNVVEVGPAPNGGEFGPLVVSPDGRTVVGMCSARGPARATALKAFDYPSLAERWAVVDAPDGEVRAGEIRKIAFSVDSRVIAVTYGTGGADAYWREEARDAATAGGAGSGVGLFDAADGRLIADWPVPYANGLAFAPDGKRLYVGTMEGRLLAFDLSGLDAGVATTRPAAAPATRPAGTEAAP